MLKDPVCQMEVDEQSAAGQTRAGRSGGYAATRIPPPCLGTSVDAHKIIGRMQAEAQGLVFSMMPYSKPYSVLHLPVSVGNNGDVFIVKSA